MRSDSGSWSTRYRPSPADFEDRRLGERGTGEKKRAILLNDREDPSVKTSLTHRMSRYCPNYSRIS